MKCPICTENVQSLGSILMHIDTPNEVKIECCGNCVGLIAANQTAITAIEPAAIVTAAKELHKNFAKRLAKDLEKIRDEYREMEAQDA